MLTEPLTPSSGRSVCRYYTVTIKATRQQHTIVDDQFHMVLSQQRLRLQQAYTAAAAGGGGWPAGLRRCCCRVNVTIFSRATLIRKLQSASDVDRFHARELTCSRV